MRKRVFLGITAVALALMIGLVIDQGSNPAGGMAYNLNPDVSHKVVLSKPLRDLAWTVPTDSIEDYLMYADLVVIGEVISDGM